MSKVFDSIYANAYDLLYRDKDYDSECTLIERIFQTYGDGHIRKVIDLGCGSGNHAIPLAQRGYKVVGVDRSENMLTHARRKAAHIKESNHIDFHQEDIRTVDLKQQFDAALMMFAVLSYQQKNEDVLAALEAANRHLRSKGLLIFDVWYGPAVLHKRPTQRVKVVRTPKGKTLRIATGELDIRNHLCTVHYHLWQLEGKKLVAETEEDHQLRYFFPKELDFFLERSGFIPIRLGVFPEIDRDPDEKTWDILEVAQKAKGK
ncbi:MAG: class I SAM-dependent methyltransferase [Candidatus Aminicenantaceae bacterium]